METTIPFSSIDDSNSLLGNNNNSNIINNDNKKPLEEPLLSVAPTLPITLIKTANNYNKIDNNENNNNNSSNNNNNSLCDDSSFPPTLITVKENISSENSNLNSNLINNAFDNTNPSTNNNNNNNDDEESPLKSSIKNNINNNINNNNNDNDTTIIEKDIDNDESTLPENLNSTLVPTLLVKSPKLQKKSSKLQEPEFSDQEDIGNSFETDNCQLKNKKKNIFVPETPEKEYGEDESQVNINCKRSKIPRNISDLEDLLEQDNSNNYNNNNNKKNNDRLFVPETPEKEQHQNEENEKMIINNQNENENKDCNIEDGFIKSKKSIQNNSNFYSYEELNKNKRKTITSENKMNEEINPNDISINNDDDDDGIGEFIKPKKLKTDPQQPSKNNKPTTPKKPKQNIEQHQQPIKGLDLEESFEQDEKENNNNNNNNNNQQLNIDNNNIIILPPKPTNRKILLNNNNDDENTIEKKINKKDKQLKTIKEKEIKKKDEQKDDDDEKTDNEIERISVEVIKKSNQNKKQKEQQTKKKGKTNKIHTNDAQECLDDSQDKLTPKKTTPKKKQQQQQQQEYNAYESDEELREMEDNDEDGNESESIDGSDSDYQTNNDGDDDNSDTDLEIDEIQKKNKKKSISTQSKSIKPKSIKSIKSTLFKTINFLFTGIDDIKKKSKIEKLISNGSGKVYEDFKQFFSSPSPKFDKKQNLPKKIILAEQCVSTIKYIRGIVEGVYCISIDWITESSKDNQLKPYEDYLLPIGKSVLNQKFIYPSPNFNISELFDDFRFELSTQNKRSSFIEDWSIILKKCGGKIVQRMISNESFGKIDAFLLDGQVGSYLLYEISKSKNVPIVSTQWVIQSIIHQKRLDYNLHPSFLILDK